MHLVKMYASLSQWTFLLGAIIATAAVSACGTQDTRPPLTAGLSGKWAAISEEFDRRVIARFPVGSSEREMVAELQHQGCVQEASNPATAQEHEAVRREDNWVCRQAARIYWRADDDRLTAIRGRYREEGCL
jgi:hypothetical protein